MARRKTFLDGLRAAGEPTVVVDSGDLLFKTFYPYEADRPQMALKARHVVECMNLMGMDAVVPGELEFTQGREFFLKQMVPLATFPFLSCNALDPATDTLLFEPFRLLERGGVRVLLVGACTWDYNVNRSDEKVRFADPLASVRRVVEEQGGSADLVVVVSHLGLDGDRRLAEAVPRVDVIVGGHSAEQLSRPVVVGSSLIVQAHRLGKYVGKLSLELHPDAPRSVAPTGEGTAPARVTYRNILMPLTSAYAEAPAVSALVGTYREGVVALHAAAPKGPSAPVHEVWWFDRLCGHCHKLQYEFWQGTAHAKAMATLERRNAHRDVECVGCHSIGFRRQGGFQTPSQLGEYANVQCEACHGPGSDHAEDDYTERARREATCRRCHDEDHDPDFNHATALPLVSCPLGGLEEE